MNKEYLIKGNLISGAQKSTIDFNYCAEQILRLHPFGLEDEKTLNKKAKNK
jgi:hypothetical protein